jgi:predicted kinase
VLVVVSGLPGVGKSAIAVAPAKATNAVHLSIDAIEDGLLGAGLGRGRRTGIAGASSNAPSATSRTDVQARRFEPEDGPDVLALDASRPVPESVAAIVAWLQQQVAT